MLIFVQNFQKTFDLVMKKRDSLNFLVNFLEIRVRKREAAHFNAVIVYFLIFCRYNFQNAHLFRKSSKNCQTIEEKVELDEKLFKKGELENIR